MNMAIIIIGAGAAGLMAARDLSRKGKKVIILEAKERIGGRIHTIPEKGFGIMEAGAEFIHGNLELTFKMLKKAGLKRNETTGKSWVYREGELRQDEDMI